MNGYEESNKEKYDNDIPYRHCSSGFGSPEMIGHWELCNDK